MQSFLSKLGVATALMFAVVSTTQALPITGKVQFFAEGSFVDATDTATTNASDATGFDFVQPVIADLSGSPYSPSGLLANATGDVYDMLMAGGSVLGQWFQVTDFNLVNIPPNELLWEIAPVKVGDHFGTLIFEITGGGVVDDAGPGFDLRGEGIFTFVCDDNVACSQPVGDGGLNALTDAFEATVGQWSISNTGNGDFIVGFNVPAPATVGLFGFALVGLSLLRRRKQAA